MTVDKECEICGVSFVACRRTTRYCPDCRNHSSYKRNMLERQVAMSKFKMDEDIIQIENTCGHCGKKFISIKYPKMMCSSKCENEYKISKAKCAQCGKMLAENGIEVNLLKNIHFCNENCENEYRLAKAISKGLMKTCGNCNKTYIAAKTNQKYCSKECSKEQMKMRPITRVEKPPVFLDKYVVCIVCRKRVIAHLPEEVALDPSYRHICSDVCKKVVENHNKQSCSKK